MLRINFISFFLFWGSQRSVILFATWNFSNKNKAQQNWFLTYKSQLWLSNHYLRSPQQPMAWLCSAEKHSAETCFVNSRPTVIFFWIYWNMWRKVQFASFEDFRQNGVTFPRFSVSCQDFVRPNRPRSRVIEAAPYAVCLALFGVSPLSKSSWGLLLTADRRTLRTVGENIWKQTIRFKAVRKNSQDLQKFDIKF